LYYSLKWICSSVLCETRGHLGAKSIVCEPIFSAKVISA
jgi:hypothetical protein